MFYRILHEGRGSRSRDSLLEWIHDDENLQPLQLVIYFLDLAQPFCSDYQAISFVRGRELHLEILFEKLNALANSEKLMEDQYACLRTMIQCFIREYEIFNANLERIDTVEQNSEKKTEVETQDEPVFPTLLGKDKKDDEHEEFTVTPMHAKPKAITVYDSDEEEKQTTKMALEFHNEKATKRYVDEDSDKDNDDDDDSNGKEDDKNNDGNSNDDDDDDDDGNSNDSSDKNNDDADDGNSSDSSDKNNDDDDDSDDSETPVQPQPKKREIEPRTSYLLTYIDTDYCPYHESRNQSCPPGCEYCFHWHAVHLEHDVIPFFRYNLSSPTGQTVLADLPIGYYPFPQPNKPNQLPAFFIFVGSTWQPTPIYRWEFTN